jgi:hypothetical protein
MSESKCPVLYMYCALMPQLHFTAIPVHLYTCRWRGDVPQGRGQWSERSATLPPALPGTSEAGQRSGKN